MRTSIPIAVLLLLGAVAAANGVLVSAGERPLADAGLDQDVSRGATVLLDGTGSLDSDGTIEAYRWTIRTPNNATITPKCTACARTSFEPDEVGRYRVTLTVTDDDGNTQSDHLFIDVAPGEKPSVGISGSNEATVGESETYTADIDPGSAALDYVVWTVDGTEIANRSLSATQETDEVTKLFPTPGEPSLTVTVYDEDGQTSTDTLQISVQSDQPEPSPSPSPTSPSPTSPTSPTPTADSYSPTISGERTVTGRKPLRGTYSLRSDVNPGRIRSIEWRDTAGVLGSGSRLSHDWTPGDHEIYAVVTYVDGSRNIATFPNGETDVVADPRPNVSFASLDRFGAISGTASAADEYGNLQEIRVNVDGRVVETSFGNLRGRHRLHLGERETLDFSEIDFVPGKKYRVTLVATDDRGQTVRSSRKIVPVKKPEIVKSEFVNGPMDSYHPRIAAERYAAHHVLKIDLNGVAREKVEAVVEPGSSGILPLSSKPYSKVKTYNPNTGVLRVDSYWSGNIPGVYSVRSKIHFRYDGERTYQNRRTHFRVTPSKPEIRMEILNDGTTNIITREHGMKVDVSDSFDPDGTDLKFLWSEDVTPLKADNSTAKFSAYMNATLKVEDGNSQITTSYLDFLAYLPPRIESTRVISDGPHYPNETVRVRVRTKPFDFSKPTYEKDFQLRISVTHPKAEVVSWEKVATESTGHSDATESPQRYVGIIEIPASELSAGQDLPSITVTNKKNERKTTTVDFPEADVLVPDGKFWTNVSVENLTYTIEEPQLDEVVVESSRSRYQYLSQGYHLKEVQNVTEYVLEKRVKVSDARYLTETMNFRNERMKNIHVESSPEWFDQGTVQVEKTRIKTSSKWYASGQKQRKSAWSDSNLWNGETTGRTKEVVVDPAQYRTERQYRYNERVRRTGTRTETHTGSYRVRRTGTHMVERCDFTFACYTVEETYTYYETETYTYTTTETYTYYVTKTRTYWAMSKFGPSHDYTGRSRQIKVDDAEYETRYEVEWNSVYTETVTRYQAGRNVLVEPAQYEWQPERRTSEGRLARAQASLSEDWRMGETVTSKKWILVRNEGTKRYTASHFENKSNVVKTSATIHGDFVKRYYSPKRDTTVRHIESKTRDFEKSGVISRIGIKNKFNQETQEKSCHLNSLCDG